MKILEKGDIIKTELSDTTIVLDVNDKQAVLFTGSKFVIAQEIIENKENGKFEWNNGRYADDLKSISNMLNNSFSKMKDTLSFLAEYNYSDFVKGIISLETGVENEKVLNNTYDNYMNNQAMGLISEEFYNVIDEELLEESKITNQEKEKIDSNKESEEKSGFPQKEKKISGKEDNKEEMINIDGNLTGNVEIKELKTKDGKDFIVANFSVATNDEEGGVKYTKCLAYNNKVNEVEDFKKGDFVHIFGKERITQGKDNKEYISVKVYSARLLKAKEQMKAGLNINNGRSSALGKLNEYKEKAANNRNTQDNVKKDKEVLR